MDSGLMIKTLSTFATFASAVSMRDRNIVKPAISVSGNLTTIVNGLITV